MVVRYKREKYNCTLKDYFIIRYEIHRLQIKRLKRFLNNIISLKDGIIYLFIILLWIIFAVLNNLIYYLFKHIELSYLSTLWNLRTSIYTSVVLSCIVSLYNNMYKYRRKLKKQHDLYVCVLYDFENVFFSVYDSDIWTMFHPMYNANCFSMSVDYIRTKKINNLEKNKSFISAINCIKERVSLLEQELSNNDYWFENYDVLIDDLFDLKLLIINYDFSKDFKELEELLDLMYEIVEEFRFPWRIDEEIDIKIINLLNKNDANNISEDFYKRMFINEFDLDDLYDILSE